MAINSNLHSHFPNWQCLDVRGLFRSNGNVFCNDVLPSEPIKEFLAFMTRTSTNSHFSHYPGKRAGFLFVWLSCLSMSDPNSFARFIYWTQVNLTCLLLLVCNLDLDRLFKGPCRRHRCWLMRHSLLRVKMTGGSHSWQCVWKLPYATCRYSQLLVYSVFQRLLLTMCLV